MGWDVSCVGPLGSGHFWKAGYVARDGTVTMCLAWGFDKDGFKLSVEDVGSVPDDFIVYFSQNRVVRRQCRKVWQFDNVVRGQFVDETQDTAGREVALSSGNLIWI